MVEELNKRDIHDIGCATECMSKMMSMAWSVCFFRNVIDEKDLEVLKDIGDRMHAMYEKYNGKICKEMNEHPEEWTRKNTTV